MNGHEQRITQLEIIVAEQEKVIDELSAQIADQWETMERMRRKLDVLAERFQALEERSSSDIPVTRPPHW